MPQPILSRLRTKLGFNNAEVAAAGGWSRQEFAELERSGDLGVDDMLRLGDLYGVDVGAIIDRGRIRHTDIPVAALLKGNADVLTADTRFALTGALAVARDIRQVEECVGIEPEHPVTTFMEDPDLDHPKSGNVRRLAERVRTMLGLNGPVASLIDDVCARLGIVTFECSFSDRHLDAFSTWTSATGAVIVVNRDSPRVAGPLGLRVTLAHELCHVLFDREKMRTLDTFCEVDKGSALLLKGYEQHERIEQRARAFQAEFLAPQQEVLHEYRAMTAQGHQAPLSALCERWGLGPLAMAWQISNAGGPDLTQQTAVAVPDGRFNEWAAIRVPDAPVQVPELRRRVLLSLIQRAWLEDDLSVSWARELLRLGVRDFDRISASWTC